VKVWWRYDHEYSSIFCESQLPLGRLFGHDVMSVFLFDQPTLFRAYSCLVGSWKRLSVGIIGLGFDRPSCHMSTEAHRFDVTRLVLVPDMYRVFCEHHLFKTAIFRAWFPSYVLYEYHVISKCWNIRRWFWWKIGVCRFVILLNSLEHMLQFYEHNNDSECMIKMVDLMCQCFLFCSVWFRVDVTSRN